jgi:hypothetical protein
MPLTEYDGPFLNPYPIPGWTELAPARVQKERTSFSLDEKGHNQFIPTRFMDSRNLHRPICTRPTVRERVGLSLTYRPSSSPWVYLHPGPSLFHNTATSVLRFHISNIVRCYAWNSYRRGPCLAYVFLRYRVSPVCHPTVTLYMTLSAAFVSPVAPSAYGKYFCSFLYFFHF